MSNIVLTEEKIQQAAPEEFILSVLARLAQDTSIEELAGLHRYRNNIQLLDYQKKTVLKILNNFSNKALLADEVGLGKTIESGMIITEFLERQIAQDILILTPASLKFQWHEELRSKFGLDFTVASDPADYSDDLVIASIDTAKQKSHKRITERLWDLVIVDEAHKLKNKDTLNYKLVKALRKDRLILLTATPLQNSLFDLWSLLDLLHPGLLGTLAKFKEDFVADKEGLRVNDKQRLKDRLSRIMVRNLRKDSGIDLPKRNVLTHIIEYDKDEFKFYMDAIGVVRKRYSILKKEEKKLDKENLKKMAGEYRSKGLLTFQLIMLTRQITSSIKAGLAALGKIEEEGIGDLITRGADLEDRKILELKKILKGAQGKSVIFTTFLNSQREIESFLLKEGFRVSVFNGSMSSEEKEKAIEEFREMSDVLVCTDAGSEGRNLQFANVLINFDLPWNPMRIEQRIGRIHRIGQTRPVYIHNLVIKDTIEAYILNRLYEKIDLFNVSIGEMDMILSDLENPEYSIFKAAMEDKLDELGEKLKHSRSDLDRIKDFDREVFDA